jgi:hypothetical protein
VLYNRLLFVLLLPSGKSHRPTELFTASTAKVFRQLES